jgi:disintegrin and metalloproteinase domain-containing protein 10
MLIASQIDDDSACNTNHFSGELNQFCLENIDVSNFLNLHSLGNHEDFCLAYVFTYRDFTGGTLGNVVLTLSRLDF